jgi:hypothetical protein
VRILVGAFKDRVAYADRVESRWPEEREKKVKAAEKRARRQYKAAKELLEEIDLANDTDAARMHALNLHSLFEEEPSAGMPFLDQAIAELERLVTKTDAQQRLENIISLCAALYDKSEATAPEISGEVLRRIVDVTRQWLPTYQPEANPLGYARLNLFLAHAQQDLGERNLEDPTLAKSEAAYNEAIKGLTTGGDPGGLLIDAKSGLAAVLQVTGEKAKNPEILRRAVALHRELVEVSRGAGRTTEEAGPFENLAGSLKVLADLVEPEEAAKLRFEAKESLERSIKIYEQRDELEQARLARDALEVINAAITKASPVAA